MDPLTSDRRHSYTSQMEEIGDKLPPESLRRPQPITKSRPQSSSHEVDLGNNLKKSTLSPWVPCLVRSFASQELRLALHTVRTVSTYFKVSSGSCATTALFLETTFLELYLEIMLQVDITSSFNAPHGVIGIPKELDAPKE